MATKALVKKDSHVPAVPREKEQWEKDLENKARDQRSQETLGVPRVTHQGGVMQIDGKPVAEKFLRVIPLGYGFSKEFQEKEYTPGSKDTPVCFAFKSDSDKGMVPHPAAPKKQAEACDVCPHNKFGTALKGSGKRCQDRRRLLFILADDLQRDGLEETEKAILKAPHYMVSIPPGSLGEWGEYLKSLPSLTPNGAIEEAITKLYTENRPTGGHSVKFEFLDVVPRAAMPALLKRGQSTWGLVSQPFPQMESAEEKAAKEAAAAKAVKGQAAPKRR